MLVGERMTHRPVTASHDMPLSEALELMRQEKIRRLPVLDKHGKLVGIVTEKDLLYASPSPATSLSIHELHFLLSRVTVADVMTKPVITVEEDTPLEEVARIMADKKVGSTPVMRGGNLVGIITETDVFKILIELLGARDKGIRLTLMVPERVGMLADLSRKIADLGGNIVALGTFQGDDPAHRLVTVKVQDIKNDALLTALEGLGIQVQHVREI